LGEQSATLALETGDTVTLERVRFLTLSQIGIGELEAAQKSLHRAIDALAGKAVGELARSIVGIEWVLSRAMGLAATNTGYEHGTALGSENRYSPQYWLELLKKNSGESIGEAFSVAEEKNRINWAVALGLFAYEAVTSIDDASLADPQWPELLESLNVTDEKANRAFPIFDVSRCNLSATYAWRVRDEELAQRVIETRVVGDDMPFDCWLIGSNRHATGLMKYLTRVPGAAEELEEVVQDCRKAGAKVELAKTLIDFSEMLLDRNAPGNSEKVTELQDEAITISTELDMKPLLERVLGQREILKA